MALTKVAGDILDPGLSIAGVVTATAFDGPFRGGSSSDIIAGVGTFTELDVNGNADFSGNVTIGGSFTVQGDYTTLNTTLRNVELLRVSAASTLPAGIVTQTGTGDILRLYDNTTQAVTVQDGGKVLVGTTNAGAAAQMLTIYRASTSALELRTNTTGKSTIHFTDADGGATPSGNASYRGFIEYKHDDDYMRFATSASEKLRITSAGAVGIGTVTPTFASGSGLHIHVTDVPRLRITNSATGVTSSDGTDIRMESSDLIIQNKESANMRFYTGGTEKLRIDSDGNIGAGIAPSSGARLWIATNDNPIVGTRYNAAADGAVLFLQHSRSNTIGTKVKLNDNDEIGTIQFRAYASDDSTIKNAASIKAEVNGTTSANGVPADLIFNTGTTSANATEKLRITTDGKVGIGTEAPTVNLHAFHATNNTVAKFESGDAGVNIRFKDGDTTNEMGIGASGNDFYVTAVSGGEKFRVTSAGNLTVTGSTANLFTSNSYNVLELRADENNDGGNDDCIFKFTHDGTFRSEMRYDESSSTLEISTADNRDDFSMDTDGKVTFAKDIATAQDYPNIRPTLDFNFAAVKKLDPRITYTRTGPASYTNEFGKLVLVGANTPRFDHDPYTRESKGLLIEESRTNLMKSTIHPHVGKYTYGSNSNGAIVEVSDDVLAPDGSAHTLKLHWTNYKATQNGYIRVGNQTEIGTLAAATYGFSFFVKRGTDGNHNMEEFLAGTATGIGDAQHHFTIQEFSPASSANVKLCNNSAVTIDKYPDGWYRLSGTITTSGSSNPDNTGASYYVLGNSNFKTFFEAMPFYHWGFQLEVGACPTSYIGGTVSATTTRGWEVPTITGTDLTDIFNPTEGTMFYEASVTDLTNDNQPIVAFRDVSNTAASYHAMGHAIGGSAGNVRVWARDATPNNVHLTSHSGLVAGNPYKHMYGYKYNDYSDAFTQGSTSAQTNTTSGNYAMLTAGLIDELRFGGYYSGPETTTYSLEAGHIKRFSYWPQKLTNTQIKTYVS